MTFDLQMTEEESKMTDSAEVSTISELTISSGTATLDLSDLHGNTESSKDDEFEKASKDEDFEKASNDEDIEKASKDDNFEKVAKAL